MQFDERLPVKVDLVYWWNQLVSMLMLLTILKEIFLREYAGLVILDLTATYVFLLFLLIGFF